MTEIGLHTANYFFYIFHSVLILFNLFGWLHRRTRKLNLITLSITFASWLIVGFWKGFGYCFLTDWHYSVLRKLGEDQMPSSYIAFLVQKLTGWLPKATMVDSLTLGLAVIALMCSIGVNFRSRKLRQ